MSHLARYDSRPVREVVTMSGPAAAELLNFAMGARTEWTYRDWMAKLAELEACDELVGDWRAFRS